MQDNVTDLEAAIARHPAGKKRGPKPGSTRNPNAPRDSKRAQERRERERRVARFEAQEAKRAEPIQPDQPGTLVVALALAGVAMVTSGIISYNGITAVAQFVGLSAPWLASLFFGFIELLIVVFTILYLVISSRSDENGRPMNGTTEFAGMVTFSAIAVYGNLIHTLNYNDYAFTSIETWTGVVLSVAAPVAVIWLTRSASRVLFAKTVRL